VPKRAIAEGVVSEDGLEGDRQRNLKHHGGPNRALCLFPLEEILALQAQGHPIFPGSIGENITIAGVDWQQVKPGARLRLGETLEIEITSYTQPCHQIKASFSDGNFNRISAKKAGATSRTYARVLKAGRIQPGDPVLVLNGSDRAQDDG
jgi:MOSC domain-containing protein YiiM